MAQEKHLICHAAELAEGGGGVRFQVESQGEPVSAFAVRYDGEVRAFVNRCAHVPVELDWQAGEFFDYSGLYLVCSTHGALYDPVSGACRGGPCGSRGLTKLAVEEFDGKVYLLQKE